MMPHSYNGIYPMVFLVVWFQWDLSYGEYMDVYGELMVNTHNIQCGAPHNSSQQVGGFITAISLGFMV